MKDTERRERINKKLDTYSSNKNKIINNSY